MRRGPPQSDRPESEEPQETGLGSQDRRGGLLRGSGNILWPEGRQGARSECVWRTCPPKWAEGKRKPLQEEEHSTGRRVRKWERWEEASAGWAATGSGAVEKGEHMNPGSEGSSASRL